MSRILSIEEFEYQTMLGSTNDAFVWGIGEIQWNPGFLVSPNAITSDDIFNGYSPSNSVYLHPISEMNINEDRSGYKKAIEKTIKNLVTDGNTFWDIAGDGNVRFLSGDSKVSVNIDDFDQLTISLKTQDSSFTSTMSLEDFLGQLKYSQPTPNYANIPVDLLKNEEVRIPGKNRSIDYMYYSKQARKISGYLNSVQAPLGDAFKRMVLYKSITNVNPKASYPVSKAFRLPQWKWLGKLRGFGTGLTLEIPTPVIKWGSLILKQLSGVIGGLGVVFGIRDILTNGFNVSNVLHTTMSVLTLCPKTRVIAGCYFLINGVVEYFTGQDIGEHIEEFWKRNISPLFNDKEETYSPMIAPGRFSL